MSSLQLFFIAFTFGAPPLLWLLSRWVRSPRLVTAICWLFAGGLILAYAGVLWLKSRAGLPFRFDDTLPMHLCDWAALVTVLALIRRSPLAFELAYCWGLAGTVQALFTPAIDLSDQPRTIAFFLVHSIIPASVLWLMFECKLRPRPGAYWRVLGWSQVYFGSALLTNRLSGGNYGFLAERPYVPSLLDHYPDTWWLYVLLMNLTAAAAFAVLLLPWKVWSHFRVTRARASSPGGTGDALR